MNAAINRPGLSALVSTLAGHAAVPHASRKALKDWLPKIEAASEESLTKLAASLQSYRPLVDAARFIAALTGSADTPCTFQTFDDSPEKRPDLARILHGTLAEQRDALRALNQQGAGIFVTVNATNLKGRKASDITGVRAVFADFDGEGAVELAEAAAAKLPPSIVVESSPGKRHLYWLTDELTIAEFASISKALAKAAGSDTNATDIARVLRLPGFEHRKGEPVPVKLLSSNPERRYGKDAILSGFGITVEASTPDSPKESHSDPFDRLPDRFWTPERVAAVLKHLDPNMERAQWRVVGLAMKNQFGAEVAEPMFREWSSGATRPTFEAFNAGWQDIVKSSDTFQIGALLGLAPAGVVADIRNRKPAAGVAEAGIFVSFSELLAMKTNPSWLIRGFIEAGTLNAIAGPPKNYKSFMAIDMGLCIAAGISWCGRTVTQGAVFVIAGEGSGGMSRRIAAWRKVHPEVPENIPFYVTHKAHTLNAEGAAAIAEAIAMMVAKHGVNPVLVIVDTLARAFEGDENKTEDMNKFILNVDTQLKRDGQAVIVVHHSTKSENDLLRGAGSFRAALDGLFEVAKGKDEHLMRATFSTHFLKDSESQKPMTFNMEKIVIGVDDELEDVSSLVPSLSMECRQLSARSTSALVALKKLDKSEGVELTLWQTQCDEDGLLGEGGASGKKKSMQRLIEQLDDNLLIEKSVRGFYTSTH